MPTSDHRYISDCIGRVRKMGPHSVLDLGVGFGKWGLLFREYLDVMQGRVWRKDWTTIIDGVEIFERYIGDHQRAVYDEIWIKDIVGFMKNQRRAPRYELVFASDVLEHLDKDKAQWVMRAAREYAKAVLVNVPLGNWPQDECYGNPHEAHVSTWTADDFADADDARIYDCNGREIISAGWGI